MRFRSSAIWLEPVRALAEAGAYFVAEAGAGFRRNGLMTAAAVTTVTVALITVGAAVLGSLNLSHLAATLDAQVEVVAFLRDGLNPAAVGRVQHAVGALPGVAGVQFVGRAEALARLQRRLGESAAFAELGGGNPLPDSLEVRLADARMSAAVAAAVRRQAGVDEVTYGAQVVDRLLALTQGLRLVAVLLTVFLAAVALIVVVNTLRLTVIARRQEIEIMGLVGATRWFIRWPFVLEGMLQGLVAAAAAACLLAAVYAVGASRLASSLPFLPVVPASAALIPLSAAVIIGGAAVGAAGSLIAVRRFLSP